MDLDNLLEEVDNNKRKKPSKGKEGVENDGYWGDLDS